MKDKPKTYADRIKDAHTAANDLLENAHSLHSLSTDNSAHEHNLEKALEYIAAAAYQLHRASVNLYHETGGRNQTQPPRPTQTGITWNELTHTPEGRKKTDE